MQPQLNARITELLADERDSDPVLTGLQGRSFLRAALASLGARQQVILMGHAVPMPVKVWTSSYDGGFYQTAATCR